MAILTNKEYHELMAAKKAGDTELVARIQSGLKGDEIEAEILPDELDVETINDKLAAGMSQTEIAKEFGVTRQKVSALLKAGGK